MESKQFRFGQVVYAEGDPINSIYLVVDGEFELSKRLKKPPNSETIDKFLGPNYTSQVENVLAQKLSEIKDIPRK